MKAAGTPAHTRKLLKLLGEPDRKLSFIHIAGTNGKGSTAAMLESILRAQGSRTGLFTSPHLVRTNERIKVNGLDISDEELESVSARVRIAAESMEERPHYFEFLFAAALLFFLEKNCDFVVLEAGLGGRLDPTNAIDTPLCAVITSIGIDHSEILGGTLEEIALEKAGIIKEGGDAVIPPGLSPLDSVFEACCRRKGAKLRKAADAVSMSHSLLGQSFLYRGTAYETPLLGVNQLENAALALETIELLREKGYEIGLHAVRKGLCSVCWPARFELIRKAPPLILDGGHNPPCAAALVRNIEEYFAETKVNFVLGMMRDKDVRGVIRLISPLAKRFVAVRAPGERALTSPEMEAIINETLSEAGFSRPEIIKRDSVEDALSLILAYSEPTVIFGSLYLAGEVLRLLETWKLQRE